MGAAFHPPLSSDLLNPRQERFCLEYVTDENGTRAAIEAGTAPASARVQAHRWLKMAKVQDRMTVLRAKVSETPRGQAAQAAESEAVAKLVDAIESRTERLTRELEAIAHSDIGELSTLIPIEGLAELPEHVRRAISKLEVVETTRRTLHGETVPVRTYKVWFWDKLGGIRMLGGGGDDGKRGGDKPSAPGDVSPEVWRVTWDIPKASG